MKSGIIPLAAWILATPFELFSPEVEFELGRSLRVTLTQKAQNAHASQASHMAHLAPRGATWSTDTHSAPLARCALGAQFPKESEKCTHESCRAGSPRGVI
eukprot:6031039-Pyramimonas_sp.AAC.1